MAMIITAILQSVWKKQNVNGLPITLSMGNRPPWESKIWTAHQDIYCYWAWIFIPFSQQPAMDGIFIHIYPVRTLTLYFCKRVEISKISVRQNCMPFWDIMQLRDHGFLWFIKMRVV